jgi:A nuclease family of the HNH/ENDO VII superfamily with conserved AHH
MVEMELQNHHVISKSLSETSRLLSELRDRGLFDLDAPENRIKLPSQRPDARAIEKSAHNGGLNSP